jgi:FkbM family methyltransferase
MISYAQNLEDVVLFRLTSIVPVGSFVDVGAAHPILENPTYALYKAGWRGINIEPMSREAEMLRRERPDDVTLQVAVGDAPGKVTLYEAPVDNRGATTADHDVVARYEAQGQSFVSFEADVVRIADVVAKHHSGELHVLKIDVEGMERQAIIGADLAVIRPWVVVIEATMPNSTTPSHDAWEKLVLDAGYVMTLFDGLNRFYVRQDKPDVQGLLSAPANVFDGWMTHTEAQLRENAVDAEIATKALRAELDHVTQRALRAEEYAASLVAEREAAAPHIAVLQQRAELAQQLEQEVAQLRALTRLGR